MFENQLYFTLHRIFYPGLDLVRLGLWAKILTKTDRFQVNWPNFLLFWFHYMANLKYTQFHCLKATKNSSFSHIQIYPSSISISNFLPPYIHTQVQDHSKALIKMKPNNLQWPLGYILRRIRNILELPLSPNTIINSAVYWFMPMAMKPISH